ncbi:MAG: hypothetical protein ACI4AQ_01205 [Lachnospiraceae bacterium]
MLRKQVVATNNVDRQNEIIADEVLCELAESINTSDFVMKMGLNHDISIMPVGKVIKGSVVDLPDNSLGVEAQIDDFICDFHKIEGPDKQILYRGESAIDKRPFMELEADGKEKITVMLSPLNFGEDDYDELIHIIYDECDALVENSIKKSFIPDPEIVVQVIMGTIFYLTTKNTVNKVSEKLADKISDDVVNIYDNLKKIIVSIGKKVVGSKKTTYVLTEPGQDIELVVKASSPEDVLNAIEMASDGYIAGQTEKYRQYLSGSLKKIQYLYNVETKKWEVNYMVTNTGQVIGSEKCYKKAVTLYNTIMKTPGAGFSIGGMVANGQNDTDDV